MKAAGLRFIDLHFLNLGAKMLRVCVCVWGNPMALKTVRTANISLSSKCLCCYIKYDRALDCIIIAYRNRAIFFYEYLMKTYLVPYRQMIFIT